MVQETSNVKIFDDSETDHTPRELNQEEIGTSEDGHSSLHKITVTVMELEVANEEEEKEDEEDSQLFSAARARDLDNVRLLLEHGADPTEKASDGSSVIFAVFDQSLDAWLLSNEEYDQECRRVLVELLAAGAPLDGCDARGRNVLHLAAELKLEETLKMLLARRDSALDLEARDKCGLTPLHFAAQTRNKKIVDLLLEAGASVESYTDNDRCVLHALLDKSPNEEKEVISAICDELAHMYPEETIPTPDESIEQSEEKEEVNEIFDELASKFAEKNISLADLDKRDPSLLYLAGKNGYRNIAIRLAVCRRDAGKRSKEELDHCSTPAPDDDVCARPAASAATTATSSNVAETKIKIEPKSYDELPKAMFEKDERLAFTKDDEGRLPIQLEFEFNDDTKTNKLLTQAKSEPQLPQQAEPKQTTTTMSSDDHQITEPSEQ